ncbi:MAG: ACT domain-containing protein, partial [Ilumatobacteraceae bacterium]
VVHLLVADAAGARSALEGAGYSAIEEREVLTVDIDDRPGVLGELASRIADAGVNVDLVYLATGPRLVLGAADLDALRDAL